MEKVLLILESDTTEKLLIDDLADFDVKNCSADEAADTLAQFRPDALILDLFLSGADGFTVLEQCREHLPPVVLALSAFISPYVLQKAQALGAGFVIGRPCTIDYIVMRLKDMLLLHRFPELPNSFDPVDNLLEHFWLQAKPRVLSTLRAGILVAIQDPNCLLTKEIYPVLCKIYGGSQNAVDQAFRRTIQNAWSRRTKNPAIWDTLFPDYTECPGNGDFISTLAEYLRRKYPSRFKSLP